MSNASGNAIAIRLDDIAPEFMRINWESDGNGKPSHIGFKIGENFPEIFLFRTDRADFVHLILECEKNNLTIGFTYANWQGENKKQIFATYEITDANDDAMLAAKKRVSEAFLIPLKAASNAVVEMKTDNTKEEITGIVQQPDVITKRSATGRVATIAAVAVPFFLVAGGFLYLNNNKDPLVIDSGQVQMTDPQFTEQVELTKATLKAMGLDPGASGDVGCLAPQ